MRRTPTGRVQYASFVADHPEFAEIKSPGFCPWCGSPAIYRTDERTPLWKELADERGVEAPDVIKDALHTDAYVAGCPGCSRVSHVIGHHVRPPHDRSD